MYKSFEGFSMSPYTPLEDKTKSSSELPGLDLNIASIWAMVSNKEGATFINDTPIKQNIVSLDSLDKTMQTKTDTQYKTYADITKGVTEYVENANTLVDKNEKYHYNDMQDHNDILKRSKSKDIRTTLNDDINAISLYQNTVYISGVLACSTLIIVLLMMREK